MELKDYTKIKPPIAIGGITDTLFGDGQYLLPQIKFNAYHDVWPTSLTVENLMALLIQPSDDLEYSVKAQLYRVDCDIQQMEQRLRSVLDQFSQSEPSEGSCLNVDMVDINDIDHYHIDLSHLDQPGSPNCLHIQHAGETVATIIKDWSTISIYSDQPLYVTGRSPRHLTNIYTTQDLCTHIDRGVIDKLQLYGNNVITNTDNEHKIKLNEVNITSKQQCDLNGQISCRNITVRAADLYINGKVTSKEQSTFIAEYADIHGAILSKQQITVLAMHWREHNTATVHTPGSYQLSALLYEQDSTLSASRYSLQSLANRFNGKVYADTALSIQSTSKTVITPNAKFVLNGTVNIDSKSRNFAQGHFTYSKKLKIAWKSIVDPTLQKTAKDSVLSTLPEYAAMGYLKNTETNEYGLLYRNFFDGVDTIEAKPHPRQFILSGDFFVDMSGQFNLNDTNFAAKSKHDIDFSGIVNNQSPVCLMSPARIEV